MFAIIWLALALVQDTTTQPTLLLGSVYREAQAASPRVQAAHALASAARARVAPSRLPPDPQIQIGWMNYSIPGLTPMEPLGMTQIQLMQMLPLAGKLGIAARASQARAEAAAERAIETDWDVRTRAAMLFYELYAIDRGLEVDRETLRLLHDVLKVAESMYRVGEGRQADVLRAQVEIARMAEDTVRMTSMRAAMEARLSALLDRPAMTRVASPALPRFPASLPEMELLIDASRESRPMLRAARRDVDAANAQSDLARREIWPDLVVGVQYGQRPGASGRGAERMGSLMLGASIPLFAGRRQHKMREEASAMLLMAEAELMEMQASTRGSITETHAQLKRARTLAELYTSTIIPQAEAASTSAHAAYRSGNVDFMTLLDNRMAVNRYRQELFALQGEEGKSWAELEMLLGRELLDSDSLADVARPRSGRRP